MNKGILSFVEKKISRLSLISLLLVAFVSHDCRPNNSSSATDTSNGANSSVANDQARDTTRAGTQNRSHGLCDNIYFPVGERRERRYKISYQGNQTPSSETTETFTNITDKSFTVHTEYRDKTNLDLKTDINWRCTAEGLLASQLGNSLQMRSGTSATVETLKSDGVSVPAELRWRTGEKWNTNYQIKSTMQFGNSASRAESAGTIDGTGEILGEEQVTVPAGTFQAMKVRMTIKLKQTVRVNGAVVPMNSDVVITTLNWYAANVGLVKTVIERGGTTGGATATTELLSTNER